MDERYAGLEKVVSLQGLLGYLNFSQGKPDARFERGLSAAYEFLMNAGAAEPWPVLADLLAARLKSLQASGTAGFQDVGQAEAVLGLAVREVLPAYRQHHRDLLFHCTDGDLFQPFFLARVFEALLNQGGPWEETARIVRGTLTQLNDYVGYRPVAILENRPRGEPYDHERVRPVPLFIRGAGVAAGPYHDVIARALELLAGTDPGILADAGFDPNLLDELAVDPRAYDHGHPVNRRPNYVFGEWDPHHLDNQGRYRRYVLRKITIDALLERVAHPGPLDGAELLYEAAAVLAGTILMAAGISGAGPTAHDSSASLSTLMPRIARYRDGFYTQLLERLAGTAHGGRLRQEAAALRQPFGAARQHLNQYLARHRAAQLQQRFLAMLFAEMGHPEASRQAALRIPSPAVRLLSEIFGRLTTGQLLLDHVEAGKPAALAEVARLLPEIEDALRRGIACGALADPWNILGFQGLFPLSTAREDALHDSRVDELVQVVAQQLSLYARLLSEAAAAGEKDLVKSLKGEMKRCAGWWDRFASAGVSDVRRVHGGEALASAEHVARALAHWHERGEATADLAFWKQHLEGFRSPKAFALVVEALLHKRDFRAALALLMNWLSQVEQVPLEDGEHSFHTLALRWMLAWTHQDSATAAEPQPDPWPLVSKFFDYLEANAEDYWQVPALELEGSEEATEEEEGGLYSAAYEDVTYRDSTDDDQEGSVIGDPQELEQEFDLEVESDRLEKRLRFLGTVARLWMIAVRRDAGSATPPERLETVQRWLTRARANRRDLLTLLDAIHAFRVPDPLGSYDSLVEYDRRRVLKEQLLYTAIGTCLDTTLAVGTLLGAVGGTAAPAAPGEAPPWEPHVLEVERALLRGDVEGVRAVLPQFVQHFREEPLLFTALANGGEPRQILRVRLAQSVLGALAVSLPRLGLLRETYHLVKLARQMEEAHPVSGRGISEFNQLFETAYRAVVENVVESAQTWAPGPDGDVDLVTVLERLTTPFIDLWEHHSRTLQLSALEAVRADADWAALRTFVQKYGGDLFHARFMTLANLRGILHRGVGPYLDYLRDNPDPLHPIQLIDDLDSHIGRDEAIRHLQQTVQAVVENYEEYKDYKTTVTQSDYGENLYLLLDFLRLKANYDRHAWLFRPLVLTHEVLARRQRTGAALLWQRGFTQVSELFADDQLERLAVLEKTHGMRLGTVADRLQERFVRPLLLDRWCALIEPAMNEARQPAPHSVFAQLERDLRQQAEQPSGAGLDVPHWLRRLEHEVRRVRAAQSDVAILAERFLGLPRRQLTLEELQRQLEAWEQPLWKN